MRIIALGAAAALLIASVPAGATVLIATFSGQVESGVDGDGLFGVAGADLTGETFVARFRIDTATPGTELEEGPTFSSIVGGPLFGLAGRPVTAMVTIGAHARTAVNDYGGVAVQRNEVSSGGNDLFGATVYGLDNAGFGQRLDADVSSLTDDSFVKNARFGTAIDFSVPQGSISYADGATQAQLFRGGVHLVVQQATTVPEPKSWLLMLAGWSLIGSVMRRRVAARPSRGKGLVELCSNPNPHSAD